MEGIASGAVVLYCFWYYELTPVVICGRRHARIRVCVCEGCLYVCSLPCVHPHAFCHQYDLVCFALSLVGMCGESRGIEGLVGSKVPNALPRGAPKWLPGRKAPRGTWAVATVLRRSGWHLDNQSRAWASAPLQGSGKGLHSGARGRRREGSQRNGKTMLPAIVNRPRKRCTGPGQGVGAGNALQEPKMDGVRGELPKTTIVQTVSLALATTATPLLLALAGMHRAPQLRQSLIMLALPHV